MPSKTSPLAPVRKMVAAGLGLVAQLVALNVLHGSALQVATGLLAGGVLLGVYAAPNTEPAAPSALYVPGQVDPDPAPVVTAPPVQRRPARGR